MAIASVRAKAPSKATSQLCINDRGGIVVAALEAVTVPSHTARKDLSYQSLSLCCLWIAQLVPVVTTAMARLITASFWMLERNGHDDADDVTIIIYMIPRYYRVQIFFLFFGIHFFWLLYFIVLFIGLVVSEKNWLNDSVLETFIKREAFCVSLKIISNVSSLPGRIVIGLVNRFLICQ